VTVSEETGRISIAVEGKFTHGLTPEELKANLAPWMKFVSRSAAVNWVDTLPQPYKQAIAERRAAEGMTREMVEAAIGKPDRIVREESDSGDNETWIYGNPPAPTTFVVFERNVVTRVKKY
jgi:hypothetical protein